MYSNDSSKPPGGSVTLQVAALAESLDVSQLVQGSFVPPAAGGQVSAAGGLQDDEHGPGQDPQPAQPENHQQGPSGADPSKRPGPGHTVPGKMSSLSSNICNFFPQ